jgi:hypothetical protein
VFLINSGVPKDAAYFSHSNWTMTRRHYAFIPSIKSDHSKPPDLLGFAIGCEGPKTAMDITVQWLVSFDKKPHYMIDMDLAENDCSFSGFETACGLSYINSAIELQLLCRNSDLIART